MFERVKKAKDYFLSNQKDKLANFIEKQWLLDMLPI